MGVFCVLESHFNDPIRPLNSIVLINNIQNNIFFICLSLRMPFVLFSFYFSDGVLSANTSLHLELGVVPLELL